MGQLYTEFFVYIERFFFFFFINTIVQFYLDVYSYQASLIEFIDKFKFVNIKKRKTE